MFSVDVSPIEGNLLLRARGNEIVIMSEHVSVLKGLKKSAEFTKFFHSNALINRPARKLFDAWLKKDRSLYKKIYTTIGDMDVEVKDQSEIIQKVEPAQKTDAPDEKKSSKPKSAAKKTAKKTTKKIAKKVEASSKESPKTKKAAKKKTTKSSTKKTTKKVADKKVTKKTTTKKTTKKTAAKKTTAKKTTKKKTTKKKAAKKKTTKKK